MLTFADRGEEWSKNRQKYADVIYDSSLICNKKLKVIIYIVQIRVADTTLKEIFSYQGEPRSTTLGWPASK